MVANTTIPVVIVGALGKMGTEAIKAVLADDLLELVGAVDRKKTGEKITALLNITNASPVILSNNLNSTLSQCPKGTVVVDLTRPDGLLENLQTCLKNECYVVIGTTGLAQKELALLDEQFKAKKLAAAYIPNFSIGAVLLMQFAKKAAQYFNHAEIIELHHNQKADAPSGTSLRTAELMAEGLPENSQFAQTNGPEHESIAGARGAQLTSGIHIHSVRLPGLVAHQEVLLGAPGQLLTLRHDSFDRACFMPGVLLAIKKIVTAPSGIVTGLEVFL